MMAGSDHVLRDRDKILRDRDKALRDGLARALASETVPPPPKAKPARRTGRLKIIGLLGGWIFAMPKAVSRMAVAVFWTTAVRLRSLMRWQTVAALAAVIAALAA